MRPLSFDTCVNEEKYSNLVTLWLDQRVHSDLPPCMGPPIKSKDDEDGLVLLF